MFARFPSGFGFRDFYFGARGFLPGSRLSLSLRGFLPLCRGLSLSGSFGDLRLLAMFGFGCGNFGSLSLLALCRRGRLFLSNCFGGLPLLILFRCGCGGLFLCRLGGLILAADMLGRG